MQPELIPLSEADVVAMLADLARAQAEADRTTALLVEARGAAKKADAERMRLTRRVIEGYRQLRDTTQRGQLALHDQLTAELRDLLQQRDDESQPNDEEQPDADL